jgi:hypothetical protein
MTSRQYVVIEGLLTKAVTTEHPLLTPQGPQIQQKIRELLTEVAKERFRAEERENVPAPNPTSGRIS